jgi:ribosomal protein S18 acetylase RimI-like enzyme
MTPTTRLCDDASMVELRVLTPDEWRDWRVLRLEALTEAPYAFSSMLEEWADAPEERWRARLDPEGSQHLLAFDDGRPVGMATGVLGDAGEPAHLFSMYVGPAARGTTLAGELIDAIERWATDHGSPALCLDVRADNARAVRVYERKGFTVTGEVPRSSTDEPLELAMCKQLRSSGSCPAG